MMSAVKHIDLSDYSELIPAFTTIALMSFTFNLGIGIMAGFALYPLLKIVKREWTALTWPCLVLGIAALMFFIFYPYHA